MLGQVLRGVEAKLRQLGQQRRAALRHHLPPVLVDRARLLRNLLDGIK